MPLTKAKLPEINRRTFQYEDVRLSYLDTMTDLPTIFCLHGRFGRAETWLDLSTRYAATHRIVAPDQRGHGVSSQPKGYYYAEEMAADAARLIEHIECGPAIVVGHSMGGRIGGYLAALYPERVRALVLMDQTAAGPAKRSTLMLDQLPETDSFTEEWPLPFATLGHARAFLLELTRCPFRTTYYLQSLVEHEDGYHVQFSQQATAAIHEYQESWFYLLPRISCPVLLIRAKNSEHLPAEDAQLMCQQLMVSEVVEVASEEHHVYLSQPGECYDALDRFIAELTPSN